MGRRLVLFPLPFQGHLTPMLQLASILYSKGFSISIIHTQYNSPNPENYPQFTFHPFPVSFLGGQTSIADAIKLQSSFDANSVAPFRNLLAQIVSENAAEETVACLITDAMWHFTQAVSDSLHLPRLVLRTASLSCFVAFTYLPVFREKGYLSSQGSQLEELVPELPPLKKKDIPILGVSGAYQLVCDMLEKTKVSRGLIFNSFEELEASALAKLQQKLPIPFFIVGPFHKQAPASSSSLLPQERDCISWLNEHPPKSVLYVSFGSLAGVKEEEFNEIAWGLASSKQPFLWAIRPGLVHGSNGASSLPNGFLEAIAEHGQIVTWAPQDEVLSHPSVGGFFTHCGWNSVMEGICGGVPMLCLPFFGDQMVNATYVTEVWKVGLRIEKKSKREEIKKTIIELMVENKGMEMRQRSVSVKEKASFSLTAGGSSYKSLESLAAVIMSL